MLVKEIWKGWHNGGGRVRSEDREHVSAGLHQWGTQDWVSEWGLDVPEFGDRSWCYEVVTESQLIFDIVLSEQLSLKSSSCSTTWILLFWNPRIGGTWLQLMCCTVSHRRVPNFRRQGLDRRSEIRRWLRLQRQKPDKMTRREIQVVEQEEDLRDKCSERTMSKISRDSN